jgi:hypothetical protein
MILIRSGAKQSAGTGLGGGFIHLFATCEHIGRRAAQRVAYSKSLNVRSLILVATLIFVSLRAAWAQNAAQNLQTAPMIEPADPDDSQTSLMDTPSGKWKRFVSETLGPLTLAGGAFNASFSQVTQTDPQYGVGHVAYAERFGASVADIATQNFFGDFVVASAFHEDPRYFRKGPGYRLPYRIGYAISRALVIRKDNGEGNTFNFDNLLGSAMSTGFSSIYYPPASRTSGAMLMHFGIDLADNGFVNLGPEFWPDFRRKVLKRHR